MLKKTLMMLWALCIVCSLYANPTSPIKVKETRIPLLTNRVDNVLYYIRIEPSEYKALSSLQLRLASDGDLNVIKSVKLYYSGTEAEQNKTDGRMAATSEYISRNNPLFTRAANPSYSIKLAEATPDANGIINFNPDKALFPDNVNYFWVSIQVDEKTPLTQKITSDLTSISLDKQNISPNVISEKGIQHRMGVGVRFAGDDGSAAYRIPGMVTSNAGTLLAVYDVRYNNSADLQERVDIGLSRSTDGGQTWEKMRIPMTFGEDGGLPSAQNGVGDPAILVDETTGDIWIIAAWTHGMGNNRAWGSSHPGMDKYKTAQLVLVRSQDDGLTWSEPINITSQMKDPEWYFFFQGPGRGITMQDGTIVFAAQYIAKNREPRACIIYSRDHGKTWQLHSEARPNTTEAQVVELTPGTLMLNMRDNRGGSRAVMTTTDMGKTWYDHPSTRSALQEPVCMASLLKASASQNIFNKDILFFSNPNTTKGRYDITIKASLDLGLSWPAENSVLLDEDYGWGYSCLSMIDSETVGIIYEGSTAHMVFQAVPLKDLYPNLPVVNQPKKKEVKTTTPENTEPQQRTYSTYWKQRATLFAELPTTKKDILFVGNSITDGGEWFELFNNPNVKNRGISGDICYGVYDRLEPILKVAPKKLFLLIGINDVARGTVPDTIVYRTGLIIDKIKKLAPSTQIYVQSVLPVNDCYNMFSGHTSRWQWVPEINAGLKTLCAKQNVTFIDIFTPLSDGNNKLNPAYSNDGLHLLGAGYLKWKEVIEPYLK